MKLGERLDTRLERQRDCADRIHDIKDEFGSRVFVTSFLEWGLRKLLSLLKIIPSHGYYKDVGARRH